MGIDSDPGNQRRCVIWHQRGEESSPALLNALASRELRVETSESGHEVLAMGCREQQLGRGLIVVLDGDGESLSDQSRVLEAMEQYCPLGLVWVYAEGANPPLRGFVGTGGTRVRERKTVADQSARLEIEDAKLAQPDEPPKLRLSGLNEAAQSGAGLVASDVLDQDELAALLKPDERKRNL